MRPQDRLLASERTALRWVRAALFASLFLPLVTWMALLNPWVSTKIWGFQLLVQLALPAWVWLASRRREFRPPTGPLLWSMTALLGLSMLAAVFGVDPYRSFWSKPDRMTGLFFQLHVFFWFLMASSVWRDEMKKLLEASVAVAAAAAAHGVLQAWFSLGLSGERGAASFGNAAFLAQYLVPHVFIAAWLAWHERDNWKRTAWALAAIVIALGLLATKSRGALAALLAGALVLAAVTARRASGRARRAGLAGLAAAALVIAGYFAANAVPASKDVLYVQRLAIQSFRETLGSRALLVENAWRGFLDRPLLGWGPENFESVYYAQYDPRTLRFSEHETRQDKPHSALLELLVSVGMLGFLAGAVFAWAALREALRDDEAVRGRLLAAAFVSLLVAGLFLFETPGSALAFALLLAAIAGHRPAPAPGVDDDGRKAASGLAFVVALIAAAGAWHGELAALGPSKAAASLIIDIGARPPSPEDFLSRFERLAVSKAPHAEWYLRNVAAFASRPIGEHVAAAYAPALARLALAEHEYSNFRKGDYVHALSVAVTALSVPNRQPDVQRALEESLERMRRLSPRRQEVEWAEARRLEELGDLGSAKAAHERAVALDPAAHWAGVRYVRFLMLNGFHEEAMREVAAAPELLRDKSAYAPVLHAALLRLFNDGKPEAVFALFRAGEAAGVRSLRLEVSGAVAALKLGRRDEAERIVAEARRHYPEETQFIDLVYNGQVAGEN